MIVIAMNMATKKKSTKPVKVIDSTVNEVEQPVVVNNNESEVIPITLVGETPPEPVIKKNRAHEYKETCLCARCKRITAKKAKEAGLQTELETHLEERLRIQEQEIVDRFISSLDDQDKMIVHFNNETKELIRQNLEYVKKNFGDNTLEALNNLISASITAYLKIYIHRQ